MSMRRAPSPTTTTYSGFSTYNSDSYRPSKDAPPMPALDSKRIAKIHWDELQAFLASHLAREPPNSRSSAREKLTRLTRQQFQELSTDVYDELVRRTSKSDMPHLPNRDDFHPKRNQARQKLSTLAKPRFKDLASDVFFELGRRYPEFKEPEILPDTPGSTYDDYPSPSYSETSTMRGPAPPASSDNYNRRPSEEQRRPGDPAPLRMGDSDDKPMPYRKQSAGSQDGDSVYTPSTGRRPSNAENPFGLSSLSRKQSDAPAPSTATSGMIIPNKSTISEEEIQVPYGRTGSRSSDPRDSVLTDEEGTGTDEAASPLVTSGLNANWNDRSPNTPAVQGGLTALGKKIASNMDDEDYPNKRANGRLGGLDGDEVNLLKEQYETKIEDLQRRLGTLEDDIAIANKTKKADQDRIRTLTEDLNRSRDRLEDTETQLRTTRRDLDEAKSSVAQDNQRRQADQDDEIRRLKQRCEQLEAERDDAANAGSGETAQAVEELRQDMQNLLSELTELSTRNDELMIEKEGDMETIRQLEAQADDYKRQYERAKTDLRNMKATSSLFLQPPKNEDQIPVAPNGVILDIHVTAFQSATDALLTAARSNAPSKVLLPLKSVVESVSAVVEDARGFDPQSRDDIEFDTIQALCERAEATLSNLVIAARTHATSYGISPVSLLDAASSHVSASVTEIVKLLLVKRSSAAQRDVADSRRPANGTNGRADEWKPISGRQERFSDRSSSNASPPPPVVFDTPTRTRSDPMSEVTTPTTEMQSDDSAWEEIKPYVQNQADTVIQAIQAVLSSVRSPNPSPELAEHLTQIITIISSIVAVCKDSLPSSSMQQGQKILEELSDHCNKLSEVQALPSITKEARQLMAQSSFAIANSVKELRQL